MLHRLDFKKRVSYFSYMKILIIGSGGREHAIAKALLSGKLTTTCYVAPGNAGTSTICTNVPIKENQIKELIQFAKKEAISITFVGPEAPLVDGIVDAFQEENLAIIGPSKESAQLEGSKDWAKSLMKNTTSQPPILKHLLHLKHH